MVIIKNVVNKKHTHIHNLNEKTSHLRTPYTHTDTGFIQKEDFSFVVVVNFYSNCLE